jgi:hypothetical protein
MVRVEELSFSELVQELAHEERAEGPPDLERAIRRRSLDARLMHLVMADGIVDERRASVRVPGDLAVQLHTNHGALVGVLIDLGEGGARVHVDGAAALAEGEHVDVLLEEAGKPARATAQVQWRKVRDEGLELGLHFIAQPEIHKRRMRRLVLEILRHLPDPRH